MKPLEDEFGDILSKARAGLGMELGELSRRTGIPVEDLGLMEACALAPTEPQVRAVAGVLDLHAGRLGDIAFARWSPSVIGCAGVTPVQGYMGTYPVWGYLWKGGAGPEAAVIDTSHDPARMLDVAAKTGLTIVAICLTHGHEDHRGGLEALTRKTRARVYAHPLGDGAEIPVGAGRLRAALTPGHTPDSVSYLADGVAFVGDALFAGSLGRSAPGRYEEHRRAVREKILGLPPGTRLYPGHGPLTSVGEERSHNPFFP